MFVGNSFPLEISLAPEKGTQGGGEISILGGLNLDKAMTDLALCC